MPPSYYSSSTAESLADDTLFVTNSRGSSPDPLSITTPPHAAQIYNPHRPLPILSTSPSRASPSYNLTRIVDRDEDTLGKLFYLVSSSRPSFTRLQQTFRVEAADILKHVSAAQLEVFENERAKSEPLYKVVGVEDTVILNGRGGRPRKENWRDGSGSPIVVIANRNLSDSSSSSIVGKRKSPTGGVGVEKPKRKHRRKDGATRPPSTKRAAERKDFGQGGATEEDEEYEIEKIVDCRNGRNGRGREFLVKWKGWGDDSNQWLSEDAMGNADELVGEHWAATLLDTHYADPSSRKKEKEKKSNGGIEVWV